MMLAVKYSLRNLFVATKTLVDQDKSMLCNRSRLCTVLVLVRTRRRYRIDTIQCSAIMTGA